MGSKELYFQFQIQFEKYYNSLCKYAFSYLKDVALCEDIVQDVFLSIWEKRKDLIEADTLRFYLFVAVRNKCLTHLSKMNKLFVEPLDESETGNQMIGNIIEPPVNYSALLDEGINLLPQKCKDVFLLNRLGCLTNQQIADTLHISVKTVNNQLWKAMKLLRAFAKTIK